MSYQERDYEVVDYELYAIPGIGMARGPAPDSLEAGRYFTCLGAAQTFGCFCERPFPALVAERLGVPALNFGFAGAGPRLFLSNPKYLEHVNRGRFAVVQVMSGRSEDNSAFKTGGRAVIAGSSQAGSPGEQRKWVRAEEAWGELLASADHDAVRSLVEETRRNWVQTFSRLLDTIGVPTILFWFSRRTPEYEESYADIYALFGEFPQLVNRAMIDEIRVVSDDYVECVTERGLPQMLVSRFTGEPVRVTDQVWSPGEGSLGTIEQAANTYYPSPEMHEDAADALIGSLARFQA